MFLVDDVYDEAKDVVGKCNDAKLFRWLGDAVSLIANKGDFEGWKGYIDICTVGCKCDGKKHHQGCGHMCLTMPREVDTVLAINIDGHPTLGVGQLFNFHLNGPGDRPFGCEWQWQDLGNWYSTYRDLITPAQLVVHTSSDEDNGKEFTVFGFDAAGNVLRQKINGVWQNGLRIPTIYGVAMPDANQPLVARITGIHKELSVGSMRLSTTDSSGAAGVNLGVYEPDQTLPQFRRVNINRAARWVRVAYRRANPIFFSRFDHIPLRSRPAIMMGVRAVKHYSEYKYADAHSAEADAVRMEVEAQQAAEAPTYSPIQVVDRASSLKDKTDYEIR